MADPIDYSRPVGWWCSVCGMEWPRYPHTLTHVHQHAAIPRYLPIPEGQRPLVDDEVEDAEVVTWCGSGDASDMYAWRGASGAVVGPLTLNKNQTTVINYIVTGATE